MCDSRKKDHHHARGDMAVLLWREQTEGASRTLTEHIAHATEGPPYRHAHDADFLSGVTHALLIVGLNTMSQNKEDHYSSEKLLWRRMG
ncbi:hypothetical protein Tco_0413405 [Tanacetum coccineum]